MGQVGQVGQVGRWDRWVGGTGEMRGLWGERIGERRVNDIIFCSFAFYS